MVLITGILITVMLLFMIFISFEAGRPEIYILTITLLVFLFIILYINRKKKSSERMEEKEFLMETFRELVTTMKDRTRELDTFNENILQSVQSGVISFDKEGNITKINEAGMKILNLKEDVTGKDIFTVLRPPLTEYLRYERISRSEIQYDVNGKRVWLGFSISPLRDSRGYTMGKIITFSDITELKQLQSQIKLREKLEGLGEMAAGIAHELRNPMAVITGYAEMLRRSIDSGKVDLSLRGIIDSITKEIELMNRIIRDFLSFARYEEPVLRKVDLKGIIRESLQGLLTDDNKYRVRVDIRDTDRFMADDILMRQVFNNLIQNSIDAMPDGGEIDITGGVDGDKYIIRVTDTGSGIPEEIREKIFLPFFTTKDSGTGLGLAIVYRIVSSHGGDIMVESSKGLTRFIMRFPLQGDTRI